MVIRIRKKAAGLALASICLITAAAILLFYYSQPQISDMVAGGKLHDAVSVSKTVEQPVAQVPDGENSAERFRWPSKQLPAANKYSLSDFQKENNTPPLITTCFQTPEDVILAYYGILREASNMLGYTGGCGTIGDSKLPYSYAYELLTKEARNEISLKKFMDSFQGIGYISLMQLHPAYSPQGTPSDLSYYMVELEVITGKQERQDEEYDYRKQVSHFAYYYGIITVKKTEENCYLIQKIDYLAENFLCAPMHGWSYDAEYILNLIYNESLRLIDHIDKKETKDGVTSYYASGQGNEYRFDFVRLANGYDILLHENQKVNGEWEEVNLPGETWKSLKLTIDNPSISGEDPRKK